MSFGSGAAIYFALKAEPSGLEAIAAALAGLAVVAAVVLLAPPRPVAALALLAAVAMSGFADAALCTDLARAPVAPAGLGVTSVRGWVVDIASSSASRTRLLIAPTAIGDLAPSLLPRRIRLTLREPADVEPGEAISLHALVDPPPGPASPEGYDFARDAWFARIGGVGLALTAPRLIALQPAPVGDRLEMGLNVVRWRLARRLDSDLAVQTPGSAGGLAAAVSTSHESWLTETDEADLRNSGLAHMLAIAGLHTAAVTGFVFAAIRLLVAAWPWLALRVSGKKLAAAGGLAATCVYLALSGAHPPARRAAITAAVAFVAILCDRRAVSMRSLAWAALIILALQPVAVVQPGFQMSFCATASLVAMAELWPRRRGAVHAPWFVAWPQHARDWALAMGAVSLVAGLATAPFAIQHFNRMASYGLFANFAADLIASLLLMPALVVAGIGEALGVPFGWLGAPLAVVGWAAGAILAIAHLFATLPGATKTLSSAPEAALLTAFLGVVFACLWRGGLRWAAAPLAGAVLVWPRPVAPVAWMAADGNNAAIVADGRIVVLKPKVRLFASQAWASRRGLIVPFDPAEEARLAFDCDRSSCAPRLGADPAVGAWWSRRPPQPEKLDALCRASAILILRATVPPPESCRGVLVLGPSDFARGGAAELFRRPDGGWRIDWSQTHRGQRPWSTAAAGPLPPTDAGQGDPGQSDMGQASPSRGISDSGG